MNLIRKFRTYLTGGEVAVPPLPFPVNKITHMSENIAFPRISYVHGR